LRRVVWRHGRRVGIVVSAFLAVAALVLVHTLPRGWPRVGFEGALVLSGLAFISALGLTLAALTLAFIETVQCSESRASVVLLLIASIPMGLLMLSILSL